MSGLEIDWTIKLVDLLAYGGAFSGAYWFVYKRGGTESINQATLEKLTKELTEVKVELKTFAAILQKIAVQEVQIDMLNRGLDELRRGWIISNKRGGIDGKYP